MPGDPFQPVKPGQDLQIPARAYNAFLDAARAQRGTLADRRREPGVEFRQSGVVLVRNDSGADRARFEVLGIAGPLIAPADNLSEFQARVAFSGVTPLLGHEGTFVVLMEPLAAGAIGRAVVSGVTPVRLLLDPGQPLPAFVEVIPGSSAGLRASAKGSAQVLWLDALTSEIWAVVRLLGPPQGEDVHVLVTGPVGAGGWYPCKVQVFDGLAWIDRDDHAFCAAPNDEPLVEDTRYLAHVAGEDVDGALYRTEARESLACGLAFAEDGRLKVQPGDFLEEEKGLEIVEAVSPDRCDRIAVKAGCGFRFDDEGRLQLDLEGLAYEALHGVNDDGNACSLSVRYGCHLDLVPAAEDPAAEALDVRVESLAGPGLDVMDPSALDPADPAYEAEGCTKLTVAVACPLEVESGAGVVLNLDKLVGEANARGLEVVADETCSYLGVKEGCHIRADENGVQVTVETLAGPGLAVYDPAALDPADPDYEPEACKRLKVVGADSTYFALVVGDADAQGFYPCQIQADRGTGFDTLDSGELSFVYEPQDRPLVVGTRYLCQFQYEVEGEFVYVSQAREDLGCGLKFDETSGLVQVAIGDVVDPTKGLEVIEYSGLECDRVAVKIADGLEFREDGAIRVAVFDPIDVDGGGQVVLKHGCGLTLDHGTLVADIDPNELSPGRLNGSGLTGEFRDGCMRLSVLVDDDTIVLDGSSVRLGRGATWRTQTFVTAVLTDEEGRVTSVETAEVSWWGN